MKTLWRATFVSALFMVTLALLTTEKVAYIWTLRAVGAPDVPTPLGYAALGVLLVCPYLLAFLQGTWSVSFLTRSPDTRLPPAHNIILGLLSSTLEGACVTWFTTMAASVLPVFIVLPAVASVLSFSAISPVISSPHGGNEEVIWLDASKKPGDTACSRVRPFLAMLTLLGPVTSAAVLYLSSTLPWLNCAVLALTLLLLSVMWSPGVQFRTFSVDGEVTLNCRRLSVLYAFLKVVSVCFFIGFDVVLYATDGQSYTELAADFFQHVSDLSRRDLLIPLLMSLLSGLFSHGFAYLSLAFCQPVLGLLVPSVLSTVVSIVLCIGYLGPHVYHVHELTHFGNTLPLLLTASILASTWGLAYVLRTLDAVRAPRYLFMPYEDVLTDYGWAPGFSDQRRLLSFCADGANRMSALQQPVRDKKSRVYVCTTMYREADYEMERLLLSLQRLADGESLQNVYLEAHIFMDNGVKDTQLGDFAEQLFGLLVNRLGVSPTEARCLLTPYGMQLTCFLPGGLPLFVHLKDPAKVKPKKRWSQCMYISYVMNFRKIMWEQDSENYGRLRRGSDSKVYFISDNSTNKISNSEKATGHGANLNGISTGQLSDRERAKDHGVSLNRVTNGSPKTNTVPSAPSVLEEVTYSQTSSRKIANVGYPTFSGFTDRFEAEGLKSVSENEKEIRSLNTQNSENPKSTTENKKGHLNLENDGSEDQGFVSVGSSASISPAGSDAGEGRSPTMILKSNESLCNLLSEEKDCKEGKENPGFVHEDSSTYDLVEFNRADLKKNGAIPRTETLFEFKFDPEAEVDDDHTYILATDADMDFEPEAVAELLRMCNTDKRLGAACGRTHPIGKNCSTIVWHQIFEYAKDFWMIKSAQNVIGSVMCCPGCFSLYRASAIRQVMDKYASPTNTPFTVYVKDTGEDRWMATLMMIHGWRLRYSAFADNTTYCPDTFQEFFKQRRRWILSDIANLILVVQNMPRLLRNNECFSLVYVVYLFNMFMNNVITPGTAIVMITAGMELVFDVPYIYTTPPLAAIVYAYAFMCTRASTHVQGVVTSILTVFLGSIFVSVAVWGSYKIVDGMVAEAMGGNFQFQQHYIILMLTLSLIYAAVSHPRECHQIFYGFAYLFIFPAMHLLLPIYSIANIVDQSWGTRDSQEAKIPKLKCIPSLKKMMKLKRRSKSKVNVIEEPSSTLNIQDMVTAMVRPMTEGSAQEKEENAFWESLRERLLGNDVNKGLERAELADRLQKLRNRSLLGVMTINALWLAMLSYFYVWIDSPLTRLNLYGVISGALYGFTLIIQVIGMTICRVNYILRKFAWYLYGDRHPMWVNVSHKQQ